MVANMEITSKEMIKPSSPTPRHLRNLKLSFLDQLAPPVHIPLIFFYQLPSSNGTDRLQIHQSLKQSLSNVLTQFYPLAGRLSRKNYTIDCSDSGALFVEAKVEANLMEVIKDPSMDELKQYLPLGPTDVDTILLAVQINVFDCGGIAIAVQISHSIADGASMVNFVNVWAAVCRDGHTGKTVSPEFNLVDLFPPQDLSIFRPSTGMVTAEKIVTKRVSFDREKLEKLKLAASSAQLKDPTRVEAVSAFFWRRFIALSKAKGSKKLIGATHAVNLRPRMDPPLPNHTFGNAWRHCTAVPGDPDDLAGALRNAIRKIDGDYVLKIQRNGDELLDCLNSEVSLISSGEIELCFFSSWWSFPVYDVDYGWGRPAWVSTTTSPYKNLVIFMAANSGDGMEAWVNLLEEDAAEDFVI